MTSPTFSEYNQSRWAYHWLKRRQVVTLVKFLGTGERETVWESTPCSHNRDITWNTWRHKYISASNFISTACNFNCVTVYLWPQQEILHPQVLQCRMSNGGILLVLCFVPTKVFCFKKSEKFVSGVCFKSVSRKLPVDLPVYSSHLVTHKKIPGKIWSVGLPSNIFIFSNM